MITAYIDEPFLVVAQGKDFAKVIGRVRGDVLKRAKDGLDINAHVDRKFEIEEKSIILQTPSGNRYKMENFDSDFLKAAVEWNEAQDAKSS